MCMTEYLQERAGEMEREALARIAIVDDLLYHVTMANARAADTPRAERLVVTLLGMHAELVHQKATAMRVIEEACALRRTRVEVSA